MAISLGPSSLIYPIGELTVAMFPDGDLDANVTAWLAEAGGKTSDNDVARHWVYYMAFRTVASRIASTPSTEAYFSNVSRSWGSDRVSYFDNLAKQHKEKYDLLTASSSVIARRPAMMVVG